jgi:N-acyl-D-amino-acid deacylase
MNQNLSAGQGEEALDLIIRGGTVIDGTRAPRFDADIGIVDGRIVAIGDLSGREARQTLDARGRIVSPGFIDSHTHDDQALLSQPDMTFKVSQGVTTVVTGNCTAEPVGCGHPAAF